MKKYVAAAVFMVALAELAALAVLDRELILVATGAVVALALLWLRWFLVRESDVVGDEADANDPAAALRRWLSRTETLISRSETSRRDWDRHLRPIGYKIRVQVVDFSGGVPGDIALTLKWG